MLNSQAKGMGMLLLLLVTFGPAIGISFGIPLIFSKNRYLGIALTCIGVFSIALIAIASSDAKRRMDFQIIVFTICAIWSFLDGFLISKINKNLINLIKIIFRCVNSVAVLFTTIAWQISGRM